MVEEANTTDVTPETAAANLSVAEAVVAATDLPSAADSAAELLRRAVLLLAQAKGDPWVNKGSLWHMIKRLEATSDSKDHGHVSFPDKVMAVDAVVEVRKGESHHAVRVR